MRNSIILFLLLASWDIFGQTEIIGEVNFEHSSPIFLKENIGGVYHLIDSCSIDDHSFSFQLNLKTGYYSLGFSDTNFVQIIIQPEDTLLKLKFNTLNLKNGIQILHSEENTMLWNFMKYRRKIKTEISQTYIAKTYFPKNSIEYQSFQQKEDSLKQKYNLHLLNIYQQNKESFFAQTIISDIKVPDEESDFFKYTLFNHPSLIRSGVFTRKITEFLQLHTEYSEPGFIASVDLILAEASQNKEVYDFVLHYLLELFNQVGPDIILDYLLDEYVISDACTDLPVSKVLSNKLDAYKRLQIGSLSPSLSMFDVHGIMHHLQDIYEGARINVVFFGSSECHFCQEAKPQLEFFSQSIDPKELQIIYISLDTDLETWRQENLPKSWISLSELKGWESKSAQIFLVHKTPSFYVISNDYRILSKPKDINELINELEIQGIVQ